MVSWQEELRNLDEELASGRLSADDYRLRRDQVLSSAVAYGDPAQQQVQQPGQQPQQPFQQQPPAPPQQQAPQQPGQPSADSTQIIAPVNQPQQNGGEGERTQVVPNWQQQQSDPNRTQVVPPVASPPGGFPQQGQQASPAGGFPQQGHASPAGGFPQQQQQQPQHGYQQPQQQGWTDNDASPPWGGSDFPPISPVGSTEWVKQGPELFEDKPKGKGGKIAIIAIVAVLVLAGLGVGGYFAFSGGGDTPPDPTAAPQSSQPQPAPPSSTKPKTPEELLFEKIPEQSGEEDPKSGAIPVAQLAELAGLEKAEADLVIAAGVKQVAYRGSQKQPDETGPQPAKISVTVIPLTSPGAAADLIKQLRQYQTTNGFVQITEPLPGMPPKLNFQKKIDGDKGSYRGTWISGNNIVRVDILQNPLGGEEGEKALSGTYQRAVKKTLENYAVTS
ncbi:flagellar basal body-associated protein FliL [Amycolatopsis sp. WAC 01375]|uniref:flagellar basal body-associated FliL family protein n=1 Tax=Amycolatopsis sp. WAC 01375 TaxID=2203194 RepID=UPI000F79F3EB|nr:flagellar basal body-associated protein FliL [Amycolatopsis sp. WAC 01375]RSM82411.1 flagellar basal body-associated protein FliL [Amycolatopsis sp. WAC 01375]